MPRPRNSKAKMSDVDDEQNRNKLRKIMDKLPTEKDRELLLQIVRSLMEDAIRNAFDQAYFINEQAEKFGD